MDWSFIWKAIVVVVAGTILLRMAGRKSISQMTLPQTVIMIGIGSLLIQPVAGENIWRTVGAGAVLILTLIVIEYSQIKGNFFEKFISGSSKVLVENGKINETNLKKVRLTVDQLEGNLRQQNVTNLKDIQYATLEPNGQLGFTLKPEAQPVTKKEFKQLVDLLQQTMIQSNPNINIQQLSEQVQDIKKQLEEQQVNDTIFTEVVNKGHDKQVPKHLQ
ncbi:DUF421 domain-containing protein [Ornithinibacillus halophilus]|uniref:Uncharacterized membrane protein YcaP, DUF421 family n=1 Tax=Ornithinibacillus halophilus TaxID=930117 RepID=A0A1M5GBR5_9BACI|nr:DUF421 domain-containing protein [Ornithinibacillus halophilus]SHG01183.1 Uncharacterized membrane protein YcaP, DUF421 family [Ornithinibacillus halophilus]